jgi:Leucine-rich repeat (LRR) protein
MNNDCILCILELLNVDDICAVSQVCKQFNLNTNNQFIWKSLFNQKFKDDISTQFKEQYINYAILDNFLTKKGIVGINTMRTSKRLDLHDRNLYSIPKQIELLTQLKALCLENNYLQILPKEIGLLTQLQELWMLNNSLQSIPEEIYTLTQLRRLSFCSNKIHSVSKKIGLLTNLQYLNFGNNELSKVPKKIRLLTQLTTLYLNDNKLQIIPKEISLLKLETFTCSNNPITFLPREIRCTPLWGCLNP